MIGLTTVNIKKNIIWVVWTCLILMILPACNSKTTEKNIAIGIISSNDYEKTPLWQGFIKGMTGLGYSEGNNLTYVSKKVPEQDEQKIDSGVKELLDKNLPLIMTFGGDVVDSRARELSKKNTFSILFGPGPSPVETGLVKSIGYPSGNVTGVQGVDCISKALEFTKKIIPGAKKIYIPYNPDDLASIPYLKEVKQAASQMEVELIFQEIRSVDEAVSAIEHLPIDAGGIFMIPSPTLNFSNSELSKAAIKRRVPMVAALHLDKDVLLTFSGDFYEAGKKLSRMTQKILNGTKPSDIPVETMDTILIINLKTAEKIGVRIPNGILAQATEIIR